MTPEFNITKNIIVFATLIISLSSCFYDVRENLEIKDIGVMELNDLVKDLNLNSFNIIKDTVEMPITAWFGIPDDYLELEHFENLKDAGFNINYYRYQNNDNVEKALDLSYQVGMKTIINSKEFPNNLSSTVNRFKDHPATAGYFIIDEPPIQTLHIFKEIVNKITAIDNKNLNYINLLPTYGYPGTKDYNEYIYRYSTEIPLDIISFDFYPIVANWVRDDWYNNLEIIRNVSTELNKPFWAFALSTSHGNYPIPTLEHLRLQVYSNLAYGAKGIQYYTYWTTTSPNFVYESGPIDKDGSKTKVYDLVKQMNKEIKTFSHIYLTSKVKNINHYGNIPLGTTRSSIYPDYIKSLNIRGGNALLSEMENYKNKFYMIQNTNLYHEIGIDIKADSLTSVILKNGTIIPTKHIKEEFKLAPGDMVMFIR